MGINDDTIYFGDDLGPAIASTLAVPPAVAGLRSLDAWRETTLRHLVACEDLSFISVWSPTFLLQLLDEAPGDVEWPMLDTISCWCSSTSRRYAAELAARFPHARIQGKGLLATEGVVTIPLEDAAAPVLSVDSGFYEFEAEDGTLLTAAELELGECYEVILTTVSGLYRYRLGDRVQVTGSYAATPCLEFIGRAGNGSDLCGEKLTEEFVAAALATVPGFGFLVPVTSPRPAYLLMLDAAVVAAGRADGVARDADTRLMRNPQYRYARKIGQLPPLEPRRIADPLGVYNGICLQAGQRLGDIKPTALLSARWQERFRHAAPS